jgi:hypothetical protein
MLGLLTTHLARAVVAVELARREAARLGSDTAYELTYAEKWLRMAVRKHKAHEHIDAPTFQAQVDIARRGFEGMAS